MKKNFKLEGLDCANCAAKMEAKFNAHPGVEEAVITFATRQLRLAAEDPDSLIEALTAIANTVEHGIVIRPRDGEQREAHHHEHTCTCGHDHEHEAHHHEHRENSELKGILLGAGLFVLGLIFLVLVLFLIIRGIVIGFMA